MEPNTNPAPAEALTPVAEPAAPTQPIEPEPIEPKPAKSSKTLIWCLSILAIIGIVAAVVFAYLYFTTPTTPPTSPTPDNQSSTSTESETDEEVTITDPLVKKDLDEKIAIMHYTFSTEPTIRNTGLHPEYAIYSEGTLPDYQKIININNTLMAQFRVPSYDEGNMIASTLGYGEQEKEMARSGQRVIDGDIVRKKYLDIFGTDVLPESTTGQGCFYYYDSEYDIFYQSVYSGCGGTSPYDSYYYKNSYTTKGDYAYVYVSAGTFNAEDDKAYCDIISGSEMPEVCDTTSTRDSFTINESNYKDYAEYRLIFKKSDKGTYYFVKAEKV